MIVYGYVIDTAKNSGVYFEDLDFPEGIQFYGGYSVSAYSPEMATLGITLDTKDFLFNPIAVDNLNMKPTPEQKELMDNFEIPDKYKELFESEKPMVLIYDPTDD